jgi:hypothetical protein
MSQLDERLAFRGERIPSVYFAALPARATPTGRKLNAIRKASFFCETGKHSKVD